MLCKCSGKYIDIYFNLKITFKALVYTLCEGNLPPGCAIPSLIFHYQCVCYVCVYDVGCFVAVLASRSGYCVRKPSVPMIATLLSSSVGMSIE